LFKACGLMWHVYICDCQGRLYTGITTDLRHRMRQHGAKLLYSEPHSDKHQAARREREIKGWRREKKLEVARELALNAVKGVLPAEPPLSSPVILSGCSNRRSKPHRSKCGGRQQGGVKRFSGASSDTGRETAASPPASTRSVQFGSQLALRSRQTRREHDLRQQQHPAESERVAEEFPDGAQHISNSQQEARNGAHERNGDTDRVSRAGLSVATIRATVPVPLSMAARPPSQGRPLARHPLHCHRPFHASGGP